MAGLGTIKRINIAKIVLLRHPRWPSWWPSWKSSNHTCSRMVSRNEPKLGLRPWSDMEIQNCKNHHVMISRPSWKSSIVVCSWTVSDWVETWWKASGATWRFRIAKMFPSWYPSWPLWQQSWKSSNHICSRTVGHIELKLDRIIGVLWRWELLKSFVPISKLGARPS